MTKKTFHNLLKLCTRDNIFVFNNQLYTQIDSASMGGCASPTLAHIFLCVHEEQWLENCPSLFKPIMYRRYVDDTFVLFKEEAHVALFQSYLNAQHPAIQFTCESEVEGELPFLDVIVKKCVNNFETGVYRKRHLPD